MPRGALVTTLQRLTILILPYRARLLVTAGFLAVACLLSLIVPLVVQHVLDQLATGGHVSLLALALGLGLIFLAQAAVGLGNTLILGRVSLNVVRDLRRRLYARLQQVGVPFYDQTPAGAILSRFMDDVVAVQ